MFLQKDQEAFRKTDAGFPDIALATILFVALLLVELLTIRL